MTHDRQPLGIRLHNALVAPVKTASGRFVCGVIHARPVARDKAVYCGVCGQLLGLGE